MRLAVEVRAMAITQVLTAAVSGLRASELHADSAANNIANLNTSGYRASRVAQQAVVASAGANLAGGSGVAAQLVNDAGGPDLATEVIRLIEAETVYTNLHKE